MGLWDDIKMGIGAAPKTQDFVDRTAQTIERNQGSNAASTYSNQMTNKVNEDTGQNFQNNYTASEGSKAVIDPFKNDDNNKAAQSAQASPAASNAGASSSQSFSSDGSTGTSASAQPNSFSVAHEKIKSFIEGRSEPTETDLQIYDLNKDGSINLNDSLALLKHQIGLRPTDEATNLLNYVGGTYKTEPDSPYTTLNKDTRGYLDITTKAERTAIGDYLLRQDQAAGLGLSETIKKTEILSGLASPNVTEDYYRAVAEATAALYPEKFQFEGQLASGRYNVIDPDTGKAVTFKDKETYDNLQPVIAPDESQATDPTDLESTTTEEPEPILPSFDPQDSDNLLKLKRFDVETSLAMEAYEADPNNYDPRYDLNGDGTNSLRDVAALQQMYAGPNRGGIQKNQIFADLFLSDINVDLTGQTSQLADNIDAPLATSASINPDNGYYNLTFSDGYGGSYTASGRTLEEARTEAREIQSGLDAENTQNNTTVIEDQPVSNEDLYEDDTETVVPQTVVQPVVQGTNAVYKPIPQTDSSTYTPTPYDPSAPTYTTPAQVTTTPTQFNPQYVAGPVQQTLTLPTTTMQAGQTQTVMYRNQRGQQIPVTEVDGKPMTYVPPGYTRMSTPQPFNQGGAVGYAEGGDTSLDAEYNLATKFLGYKGPKSRPALNDFMKASPGAAARMGKYQQAMRGMYKGGVVYANDGTDVGLTDGGEADASISGEDDKYYDETLPMFFDAVSQTMQPMQSTYSTIAPDSNQFISGDAGQVGTYAPTVGAAQVETTSQATTPTYTPSATYGATGTADQVRDETGRLQPVTGQVSDQAQVDAAQGTSSLNIDAAQGTATMMTNPVTREIQSGELISGAADAQKAAKFTEQIQAAQATPSKQATVQGQLEGLMQQFESGDTPAWAAGAMRNAMGAMAARGLGASSLAGQAVVQAAMESAIPIASADAQTIASFEAQNLSNRQQRAMLAAQQRAQFMGQEFDQAFQARVQNSSRIADIANMNFTAEQQVALENSRAANTMNLANLSNRQAGVMAEAAAIANMDMANLNNRQQAAVQNAQNFMAMDMSNFDRAQQTALFRSQQNIQALFTDQAAENAALQFNASSENQTKQFFASLSSQTSQFNAAQTNAVNQFNVNSVNAISEFNANLQQQRDTFNATNGLVVSQANAQWRQNLATLNTAAANDSNMAFAAAINGMTSKNIDNIWQRERDLMSYNITSVESGKDRATQILLGNQTLEALREKIGYAEDSAESEFFMRFLFGDFGDLFGSKD